jgi:hypothetical protein
MSRLFWEKKGRNALAEDDGSFLRKQELREHVLLLSRSWIPVFAGMTTRPASLNGWPASPTKGEAFSSPLCPGQEEAISLERPG